MKKSKNTPLKLDKRKERTITFIEPENKNLKEMDLIRAEITKFMRKRGGENFTFLLLTIIILIIIGLLINYFR